MHHAQSTTLLQLFSAFTEQATVEFFIFSVDSVTMQSTTMSNELYGAKEEEVMK